MDIYYIEGYRNNMRIQKLYYATHILEYAFKMSLDIYLYIHILEHDKNDSKTMNLNSLHNFCIHNLCTIQT